ncbi:acyl-CoA dehydrogenase family protein, partial [Thalassotalea sp. G20_0]
ILAQLEHWQQYARPQVRKLITSLNEHQLLTSGWPAPWGNNDISQQLYLHYCIAQQPIGGLGLCLASHLDIGGRLLQRYGTNQQQVAWLPKALTGECLLALAMTERNAGSDLQGIETFAQKTESGWSLTGHKASITNGADADLAIVLARIQAGRSPLSYALFLVPLNSPGVDRHDHYDLLGYEGCLGGFDLNNVE